MKITILGCGAYGLALAMQLEQKNEVVIYTPFQEEKDEVEELNYRENVLPGILLPQLNVTLSLEEALKDAQFVIFAVPFSIFEKTLLEVLPLISKDCVLVAASKGIDKESTLTSPQIIEKYTTIPYIVLSGPTFASDVAKQEPVLLTLASFSDDCLTSFASCFPNHMFIEFSKDPIGVSYCGAVKNVFAILEGYLVGKNASCSTQAAVIYKSLCQLGKILKATTDNSSTLLSSSGVADFYMSAESKKSRNHTFGVLLATKTHEEAFSYLENTTVEGVDTLKACQKLCENYNLDLPILTVLTEIIQGKDFSPLSILEVLTE